MIKKIFWKILENQNIRTSQKILGCQNILMEKILNRQNITVVPKTTKSSKNILTVQKFPSIQKILVFQKFLTQNIVTVKKTLQTQILKEEWYKSSSSVGGQHYYKSKTDFDVISHDSISARKSWSRATVWRQRNAHRKFTSKSLCRVWKTSLDLFVTLLLMRSEA